MNTIEQERLLEIARKKYPIGSEIKELYNEDIHFTATHDPWIISFSDSTISVKGFGWGGCVFDGKVWATVIRSYNTHVLFNNKLLTPKYKI